MSDRGRPRVEELADQTVSNDLELSPEGMLLESPKNSWFWEFPGAGKVRRRNSWRRDEYADCGLNGARRKAQALEGNIEEVQCIRVECPHAHDQDEWEPECIPEQGWFYPSAEEAEYTADLAFALATALRQQKRVCTRAIRGTHA